MKKTNKKPLHLTSETVRALDDAQLRDSAGGNQVNSFLPETMCCDTARNCPPPARV